MPQCAENVFVHGSRCRFWSRSRYGFFSYRAVRLDIEDHRPITGPVPNSQRWGRVAEGAALVVNVHAMDACDDESQSRADMVCTGGNNAPSGLMK